MNMDIDPRHDAEQTYPTESGAEHPAAPDFADPAETQHEFEEIEGDSADPAVRNEKQIVADSHAEFPDESMGERFGATGGSRAVHDGGGRAASEANNRRWRVTAVAFAGAGIGALLLRRRHRRRRALASH